MSTSTLYEIDLNGNTNFSMYKKKDIINKINNFDLLLRGSINISEFDTFGFEFEFENAEIYEISVELEKYIRNDWKLKHDGSVYKGAEVSTPILYDSFTTWYEICDVCEILSKYSNIGQTCGAHIHIGNQILENEKNFLRFIKTWLAFEDIIFRFSFGEYTYARDNILSYALPLSKSILMSNKALDSELLLKKNNYTSMDAIYLKGTDFGSFKLDNTLEFRCPNGTLNPVIWQNNLNLFIKLLEYSKTKYNKELIEYFINQNIKKFNNYNISDSKLIYYYSKINTNKALLFSDIIFDNNLDKLYFLKQYFKNFEEVSCFKKTKKITKY